MTLGIKAFKMGTSRDRNSFQLDGNTQLLRAGLGLYWDFHPQDSHPVVQEDKKTPQSKYNIIRANWTPEITILLHAQCTNAATEVQQSTNTQDLTSQFKTG